MTGLEPLPFFLTEFRRNSFEESVQKTKESIKTLFIRYSKSLFLTSVPIISAEVIVSEFFEILHEICFLPLALGHGKIKIELLKVYSNRNEVL